MSRTSYLDGNRALIEQMLPHYSKAEIARRLGVPVTTLKSWLNRPAQPCVTEETDGNVKTIEGEARNPEELMRSLGVDPDEWEAEKCVVNQWADYTQLKVQLRRKTPLDLIVPAQEVEYQHPGFLAAERDDDEPFLVVICGDQQAPFQDEQLHERFCMWLADNVPEAGVLIGDTLDLPSISRYRDNPEWHASVQECINSGYNLLRDYVRASEQTTWTKLLGNHDERIRNEILNRAERLYGIRPADVDDEQPALQALSIRNLLRLDSLGIDLVEPDGGYEHASARITDKLAARHGWLSGNNTAKKTLDRLGHSAFVGHSHAKSTYYDTIWDIDGSPSTRVAMEIGTMARIRGGLGHTVNPNWQQGFATATIWPDGFFVVEHAIYVNDTLLWRDQRY